MYGYCSLLPHNVEGNCLAKKRSGILSFFSLSSQVKGHPSGDDRGERGRCSLCPAIFSPLRNLAYRRVLPFLSTLQLLRPWGNAPKTVFIWPRAAQRSKERLIPYAGILRRIYSAVIQNKLMAILWEVRLERLHCQAPQSFQS